MLILSINRLIISNFLEYEYTIITFLYLNTCHFSIFSEFAKEKDRVESRAGFLLLKEEQKLEREMNGYMNWICRAGKSILTSKHVLQFIEF